MQENMQKIRIDKDGIIAVVTLSNPGKLNAIDLSMWHGLADAFREA